MPAWCSTHNMAIEKCSALHGEHTPEKLTKLEIAKRLVHANPTRTNVSLEAEHGISRKYFSQARASLNLPPETVDKNGRLHKHPKYEKQHFDGWLEIEAKQEVEKHWPDFSDEDRHYMRALWMGRVSAVPVSLNHACTMAGIEHVLHSALSRAVWCFMDFLSRSAHAQPGPDNDAIEAPIEAPKRKRKPRTAEQKAARRARESKKGSTNG